MKEAISKIEHRFTHSMKMEDVEMEDAESLQQFITNAHNHSTLDRRVKHEHESFVIEAPPESPDLSFKGSGIGETRRRQAEADTTPAFNHVGELPHNLGRASGYQTLGYISSVPAAASRELAPAKETSSELEEGFRSIINKTSEGLDNTAGPEMKRRLSCGFDWGSSPFPK